MTFALRFALKLLLVAVVAIVVFAVAGVIATWAPDSSVESLKARWAQAPSQFVEVAGMPVHLRDEGLRDDAAPIVLLHGTSASLHTWDGWVAELSKTRRVIRFDLPAFGLTGPHPQNGYSINGYVKFVVAVMDKLGVQRFALAGNSLGGQIAWATAVAAPTRVSALVLVDAGGYAFKPTSVPIGFRVARIPGLRRVMEFTLPRGVVKSSVESVYGNPVLVTPELVDRYYELRLRAGNRAAPAYRMDQVLAGDVAQIKKLKMPTLILWGGQDRLIPPENAHWFARDIAGSKLVMFEALGHLPHEEDPKTTVAELVRFAGL